MPERAPAPEEREITPEEVTEVLRESGFDSGASREIMSRWLAQAEKEVTEMNAPWKYIETMMEQAKIYIDTGYVNEAIDILYDALSDASGQSEHKLVEEIKLRLEGLGANVVAQMKMEDS